MRKLVAVLLFVAATVAVPMTGADAGPKPKVDVCHATGNGSYHLINISQNAVPAHIAHGDGLPGDPVPGMPDYVFGDDCTPELSIIDTDGDGVLDPDDNCPTVANPDQSDRYGSAKGDACEDDSNGDGTLDVDEPHICVSIDGEVIFDVGDADCLSTPTTGSSPNIAVANGDNSRAIAVQGDNNTATANGDNSLAQSDGGDNNTATANGDNSRAIAVAGDNNTATANGDFSTAWAGGGVPGVFFSSNNTATTNGTCLAFANGGGSTVSCP